MDNSTLMILSDAYQNATTSGAQNSEGITQAIYFILNKIIEVLTTAGSFGFWKFLIVLFAIIGFFAVIAAIGSKILDGGKIIFKVFILLPGIFIVSIWNRKKRKERLSAWGEVKEDFKKNSKKIKLRYWILFITLRILLPLMIITLLLMKWFL